MTLQLIVSYLLVATVFALVGAMFYRWRGMNEHHVPRLVREKAVRNILCCLAPGVGFWVATGTPWGLLAGAAMYAGVIVGHGSYFPQGAATKDNERFAFITRLISNPLNETAKFVGMALTGLAVTVPPVLLSVTPGLPFDLTIAWWFASVGLLKPVVYWLTDSTEDAEKWWGGLFIGLTPLTFIQ